MNELQEKYGDKGLHIVSLYSQGHSFEELRKLIAEKKIKYPSALYWVDDEFRYNNSHLPRVWIVGVDGKIIFNGTKDYDKTLQGELAKVKFVGLGDMKIEPELEPAAKAYAAKNYLEARKLAQAVADGEDVKEAVAACAKAIVERVEDRFKSLKNRAESAEIEENWVNALAAYETLVKRFKGHEDAEEMPAHLEKLKADKKVQQEVAGCHEIREIDRQLFNKKAERKQWIEAYKEFAKKYEGTSWAKLAAQSITRMEEEQKAEEEAKKKEGEKK